MDVNVKLDLPPERLPSDSIQFVFLLVVFLVGVPSNALTLRRLLRLLQKTRRDSSRATFVRLKMHLTLADLMLLFFYVAPQLIWNITYEWIFGDILCKLYNYVSMASFYLSSNIIVCIAIDRLRVVLGALQIRNGTRTSSKDRSVKPLILPAWILALSWAAPQLVVFQTTNVLSHSNSTWMQCSDVWSIISIQSVQAEMPCWFLTPLSQFTYEVTHLMLVFWVPLVVLLVSYGTIAFRLVQVSSMQPRSRFSSMQGSFADPRIRSQSLPYSSDEPKISTGMLAKRFSLAPGQMRRKLRSYSIASRGSDVSDTAQGGALWRRKIREKLFRSTLLLVIAHFLFWFPYNFSSLLAHSNRDYKEMIALHAHFLNDLQVVITLVNPVLYAITE